MVLPFFPRYTLTFPNDTASSLAGISHRDGADTTRNFAGRKDAAGRATKLFAAPLFLLATHPSRYLARPLLRHFPRRILEDPTRSFGDIFPSRRFLEISRRLFARFFIFSVVERGNESTSAEELWGNASFEKNITSTFVPMDWYDFIALPRFIDAVVALYMIDLYRLCEFTAVTHLCVCSFLSWLFRKSV